MVEQDHLQSKKSLTDVTRTRLPLPFATGGIGLFLAAAMPGGMSGGMGFLVGFLIGLALPALVVLTSQRNRISAQPPLLQEERLDLSTVESGQHNLLQGK
jgi:hypothetical protein